MQSIASVKVDLAAARQGLEVSPLLKGTAIGDFIADPSSVDPELAGILSEGDQCTVVYYACGTCDDGAGARVEYYCSSSGGSEPDYIGCDGC